MIHLLEYNFDNKILAFSGIMFSYLLTCILLKTSAKFLPKDLGRDYAHDGKLSAGKPRGAGFIFILVFTLSVVIFHPIETEIIVYLILTVAAMLSGFLDDCAKSPWGEYKKGLLDLAISIMVAVAYTNFNSSTIDFFSKKITINPIVFIILATLLVWVSINVTNCSDGVDGLCGTLSIITLLSVYALSTVKTFDQSFNYVILIMVACILGYLWFNVTPSKMIMGDAGSRALGLFISIAILKTGSPLLYIPFAFILIIDGGLGLVKVSLLRFLKIRILTNIRTPIHDHVRKNKGWSNSQTMLKFSILQIIISFTVIWLLF